MTPPERIEHVKYWLELKQAWDRWKEGQPMPPLSDAARGYFERLAGSAVSTWVKAHPGEFEHTAPPSSDRECWAILLEYLLRKRPKAKGPLLDHIIESGIRKAAETLKGKLEGPVGFEHAINWIINRFKTQVVLSAMPDFVRQHKPPPVEDGIRVTVVSTDAPVGGEGSTTLGNSLTDPDDGRWWETETEREEVEALSRQIAADHFGTIRPAFRLSLAMRSLRHSRGVTISCDDGRVLAVAGVGRAVFADGIRKSVETLAAKLLENPAISELDPLARLHAAQTTQAAVSEMAEDWLFNGLWIDDCHGERKPAMPDGFSRDFQEMAHALAVLLRDRLRDAGKNLAENELAPVFNRLARPIENP